MQLHWAGLYVFSFKGQVNCPSSISAADPVCDQLNGHLLVDGILCPVVTIPKEVLGTFLGGVLEVTVMCISLLLQEAIALPGYVCCSS